MESKTKYGLRNKKTGNILGYYETSNDGSEFCINTTVHLSEHRDRMWLVDKAYIAEYVRNVSTEWYNAEYETPKHSFKADELEVVKIVMQIEPIKIEIPSTEKYFELAYKEKDPSHYEYIMKELKRLQGKLTYSIYDLNELIREGKWKLNK